MEHAYHQAVELVRRGERDSVKQAEQLISRLRQNQTLPDLHRMPHFDEMCRVMLENLDPTSYVGRRLAKPLQAKRIKHSEVGVFILESHRQEFESLIDVLRRLFRTSDITDILYRDHPIQLYPMALDAMCLRIAGTHRFEPRIRSLPLGGTILEVSFGLHVLRSLFDRFALVCSLEGRAALQQMLNQEKANRSLAYSAAMLLWPDVQQTFFLELPTGPTKRRTQAFCQIEQIRSTTKGSAQSASKTMLAHQMPLLFVIAHEFGHVLLGHLSSTFVVQDWVCYGGEDRSNIPTRTKELEADAFAAAVITKLCTCPELASLSETVVDLLRVFQMIAISDAAVCCFNPSGTGDGYPPADERFRNVVGLLAASSQSNDLKQLIDSCQDEMQFVAEGAAEIAQQHSKH